MWNNSEDHSDCICRFRLSLPMRAHAGADYGRFGKEYCQSSGGTARDVGMGQGRNSIWLAQQGWDVTGFDPAEKAVALARENALKLGVNLKTEIKGTENFDFGERRWI